MEMTVWTIAPTADCVEERGLLELKGMGQGDASVVRGDLRVSGFWTRKFHIQMSNFRSFRS